MKALGGRGMGDLPLLVFRFFDLEVEGEGDGEGDTEARLEGEAFE